ncbi:MAG TPA: NAD-dependent epimerase/dehydratase family protein [Vicinamibacterales bacterium]|nr:NAD-dependent epimerase/dehydratase family protein [Vicinamibacterales bacterium]
MAKYFVTGATGFIGGEIVKQLIGRGHKVAALVRAPEKAVMLKALGVEIHAGDITDRETLKAPMTGVDGLFHAAAWYKVGVEDPLVDQINVDGTRNVLQTMRALEIPHGVYTSTVAVFSDTKGAVPDETYRYEGGHLSHYDRTKWIAHYRVALPKMEEGLPLTIVMPGLVYGPRDTSGMHTALVDLLRRRLPMTPARTAFCWAHVEDTARAHIQAMEQGKPGETYIIAGPRHTFEHAFDLAAAIAGVRAPVFHPGPTAMRAMAAMMEVVGRFAKLPPALTPEALRVLAGTTYFGSSEKAARELGFAPRPLEEGMAQTLEHELRLLGRK